MSEKALVDREHLERAASVIAWMSCRSDIKAADLKRLEQCASELSCALTVPVVQAEPVKKKDWNVELSSWSDEDLAQVFLERPDLADRLRKVLDEPGAQCTNETERNAARYLWLRERISVWRTNDGKGPVSWFPVTKVPASSRIQDETDAAIDVALAGKGGAQ